MTWRVVRVSEIGRCQIWPAASGWVARPALREYLHTLYQFTDRWVVDDTKFRDTFGGHTTPLDDALATTLQWFRHAAGPDPRSDARSQALPARDH